MLINSIQLYWKELEFYPFKPASFWMYSISLNNMGGTSGCIVTLFNPILDGG